MLHFPSGTVTFLFTDVEGSTRRWEENSPAMRSAIERHFAILDEAIAAHNGVRFKTIGDAIQAAFFTAQDAIGAAAAAQRTLLATDWGSSGPLAVRMALHTGTATPVDDDYLAAPLNRLSRLLGAGHGGQILVTESTRLLVRDQLPPDIDLRDLGDHRLRDLREAERVFQVLAPGLPDVFPPLISVERRAVHLPAQITPLIGRDRESAAVRQRFVDDGVRLLTLTGPGGTGKTRLALRVAEELGDDFADGIWFVPLAPVDHASLVAPAIAEALGLRENAGEPIGATLRGYLRDKQLLLLLDNFEHVIDAAPLVAELLAAAPGLCILVTSRALLRISGEHEFSVPPLGIPETPGAMTVDQALASEAVRLFVQRAQSVRADFALTADNVGAVVDICRRLDGLPLAIELAAARIRLLPPAAILARLDSRLTLLTGGARDLPERQQTLRAAIAWSHDLLAPQEQILFRRLAVFAGGWTLEAAEAVGAGEEVTADAVIDGLETLQDNSLIQQRENPGSASEPRFSMLQTIQEFGREQLTASGEAEGVKTAHAGLFLRLAIEAEPELTGATPISCLDRLDSEYDNLRAALGWFRGRGDADSAIRMTAALWRFWWLRGHLSEGRNHLEAALALPDGAAQTARATALDAAGVLAETQGDYDRAQALHEDALAVARALGDTVATGRALGNLGVVAFDRRDNDRANSLLEESLGLARESGDRSAVAVALNDLGRVAYDLGDLDRAESLYRDSLALRRQLGNGSEIARALHNLGVIAFDREAFSQARQLFEEGLELYRDAGDKWGAAGALSGLAEAIRGEGDAAGATPLIEESLSLFQETGDTRGSAVALRTLAELTKEGGDRGRAADYYRDALSRFQSVADSGGLVDSLAGLATIAIDEGQFEHAALLFGAASGVRPAEQAPPGEVLDDSGMSVVRANLDEAHVAAAWERGARLTPEAAASVAAKP